MRNEENSRFKTHQNYIILLSFFLLILVNQVMFFGGSITASIHMSFILIGGFASLQLLIATRDSYFSGNVMHWLYIFFFMYLSPYIQYTLGRYSLGYSPDFFDVVRVNGMIMLWELSYFCGSTLINNRHYLYCGISPSRREVYISRGRHVLNAVSVVIVVYVLLRGGGQVVMSRVAGEGVFYVYNQTITLLFTYIARNIVTFNAAIAIYYYKKTRKDFAVVLLAILLVFIACSPLGMPRFQVATVYIGLLIIAFPSLTKKVLFIFMFVTAFIFAFPLLDLVRYASFTDVNMAQYLIDFIGNLSAYFTTGHFDGYVMSMKILDYIEIHGTTFGAQLMGVLFFWIPRKFWISKPIGTGHMVHNSLGIFGTAANVSAPLLAEGLINFGILGVCFFALFTGSIINSLDYKYVHNRENTWYKLVYPFIPPLFFFIMRGDLLSTFSFFSSYIVVGSILILLMKPLSYRC